LITYITAEGIWLKIPAAMIRDNPLPIPNLSICSPSHIKNTVPAVSTITAINHHCGSAAHCSSSSPWLWITFNHPMLWKTHSTIVAYRVHSITF